MLASGQAFPVKDVLLRADVEQAVLVHVADESAIHVHTQDSVVRIAAARKTCAGASHEE